MSSPKLVLRDIPKLWAKLRTAGDKNLLNDIHFALYGEEVKGRSARRHISSFSGFEFRKNSKEYNQHCELLSKSLSFFSLQRLCDFFEYKYPNSASASDLSNMFLKSFMEEFYVSNDEAEKKSQSMSVKSGKTKSRISHSQKKYELRSKLLEKQNEIDSLQENLFSNQEEIVELECEVEDMKRTAQPIEEIEAKQRELDRKQKLLKIGEARLKHKENSLSKYQEFLKKVESSFVECSSEEEVERRKSVQTRTSNVREWTIKVQNHYDQNDETSLTQKNESECLPKPGCFKRALTAIMKDRHPAEEVLQTLFCEAGYKINSRPFTHVSTDPQDVVGICLNDLFIGKSVAITTPGIFNEKDLPLKRQWRISPYLADMSGKNWLREYLPCLVNRTEWNEDNPDLKEGELVIKNEKDFPRGLWSMAKVKKVYPGPDGKVAAIQAAHGIYKRPARKPPWLNIRANQEVSTGGRMLHTLLDSHCYSILYLTRS